MNLLIRLFINAIALWVAATFVPGIAYDESNLGNLLVVALIFGVLNAFIRPLLAKLTCPLMILTLGLFTIVLNALMLLLTSVVAGALGVDFQVAGFVPALIGALVISAVSIVLSIFVKDERRR